MHHEGTIYIHYSLYGTSRSRDMVMVANSRKTLSLTFFFAILLVLCGSKYVIVSVVMGNFSCSLIPYPFLKPWLVHQSLITSKRELIFNPNQIRSIIVINGTSLEMKIVWLPPITSRKTIRSLTNKFISWKKISNLSLSRKKSPSFLARGLTSLVLVKRFLDLANIQDSYAGTAQFLAAGNLGLMIAGIIILILFGSSNVRGLIKYCMRYIITSRFQCKGDNSFWGTKKFVFTGALTQVPQSDSNDAQIRVLI